MMWLHDHVVEGRVVPGLSPGRVARASALGEAHHGRHNIVFSAGLTSSSSSTCGWALQHGQTE